MGTKNTAREVTVELPHDHVDELTADGRSLEESVHRAIRLYRVMDNPNEILAETDLEVAQE